MKSFLLLTGLLVVCVLTLSNYFQFDERGSPLPQQPAERAHASTHEQADLGGFDAQSRAEVARVDTAGKSLKDQLRVIWGRDFAANLQRMEESGIDLEAPITLRTWEEIREETLPHFTVQEKERKTLLTHYIDWPDSITSDYLVSLDPKLDRSLVDDSVLLAAEHVAAPTNREIVAEATMLVDLISIAKSSMIDSPYLALSLLLPPAPAVVRGGDMLYAGSGNAANWQFNYTIYAEDFPEIPKQKDLVRSLKKKRREEIKAFLSTLH